jgi:hypothetical protein
MSRGDAGDIANLRHQIIEAGGLCYELEQRLDEAVTNIGALMPGYRADTLPVGHATGSGTTQPENATIVHDSAVIANAELRQLIRTTLATVRATYRIVQTWCAPPPMPKTPIVLDPDDWCVSCLRILKCAPRHRGKLCRWCYDFERAEHQRPPLELLNAHHQGRHITEQMVDDALGRKRKKTA